MLGGAIEGGAILLNEGTSNLTDVEISYNDARTAQAEDML